MTRFPTYRIRDAIAVLAIAVALAATDARAESGALPRYALSPGQKLDYATLKTSVIRDTTRETTGSWTFWVVDRNDDGSWRLLVRAQNMLTTIRGDERKVMWDKAWYGRFDLHPDGRYVHNRTLGTAINPSSIFVPLPKSAEELAGEWERYDENFWTTTRVTAAPSPNGLRFEVGRESVTDRMYLITRTSTVDFDPERGLVTGIENRSRKEWGTVGEDSGTIVLHSVDVVDPAALAAFAAEAERYLSVTARYETMGRAAQKDLPTLETRLAEALAYLAAEREGFTEPELIARLDEKIDIHDRRTNYHRDRATKRAAIVDKASPDWTLLDLEGNTHALADYRGRVVILDFWYRGCTWCIRSMPQLKQVVEELRGEPFALLGMNTDKDLDDAHFVVDAMELNYPSLQATGILQEYGITAFPTLVIIDREGVVRETHVGYTADLRERLLEEVRGLLAQ